MLNRNVKLKNRIGDYLLPYTDNIPTASTSTAGKVKLDTSPISGSNNAITSGAVHTALNNKADKGTTLSSYGITDAYTKQEIANVIASEATPIYADQVTVNDDTIILNPQKSIYTKTLSGDVWSPIIDVTGIESTHIITFELYVNMSEVTSIDWTANLNFQWLSENEPDLSAMKKYLFVLRSDDGGNSWYGNLQGFVDL